MKKLILFATLTAICRMASACSCDFIGFFCSTVDSASTVVYGYKIADLDTQGIRFVVLDRWGNALTTDTINLYNDSSYIYREPRGGEGGIFQCASNPKLHITTTDTFLINITQNYTGSGFGTLADYIFRHELCSHNLMPVHSGVVRDTNWFYGYPQPGIVAVIEETVADYKNRLVTDAGCAPTHIISSITEVHGSPLPHIYQKGKMLIFDGVEDSDLVCNIYNISGQLVATTKAGKQAVDISFLAPALYIVEIQVNKASYRQKILLH